MVIAGFKPASGGSASTSVSYLLADHLGGTNVVTNASGSVVQTLDYYPYGAPRVKTGSDLSQREFIGEHYDESSGLNYLNARYYDGSRGGFISQDPVFWEIGVTEDGRAVLAEPQLQNSYSYAANNPLRFRDPDGRFIPQAIVLGTIFGGTVGVINQGYADVRSGGFSGWGAYRDAFGTGAAVGFATAINPFLGGGALAALSLRESYKNNGGYITTEDAVNSTAQAAVTTITAGYLKGLPQVVGAQATNALGKTYWFGAHAGQYFKEALTGLGIDVYYDSVRRAILGSFTNSYNNQGSTPVPPSVPGSNNSTGGGSAGYAPVLPGQNPADRYSFSGGVNKYGESYRSLFPQ
jgi:RHS repeat-associated protein